MNYRDSFGEKISPRFPISGRRLVDARLSVESGMSSTSPVRFKIRQVPHRLLLALAEDFYRPKRPMEIFSRLYPGDFYAPVFAKDRFHQACLRLRSQFGRANIPLNIAEHAGFYRLTAQSGFAVCLILGKHAQTGATQVLAEKAVRAVDVLCAFVKTYSGREFRRDEFAKAMRLSPRTARRILAELKSLGQIEQRSAGPATRYHLVQR